VATNGKFHFMIAAPIAPAITQFCKPVQPTHGFRFLGIKR
jgi:hypothetical protein